MPTETKQRCAIIGAGVSGLPAARWAFAYGHEPVIFEATNDVGGLWCYKLGETEFASVMKSTVINTSKEMNAYSDFPPPAHFPNFMHNTLMLRYLQEYSTHFNLYSYIRFGHRVLDIHRAPDYTQSGRWVVIYTRAEGAEQEKETFDSVLICTGHHAVPNLPQPFPNQEQFRGKLIHSHSYKDHRSFEDSVVAVVGIGNSGVDVAVELSHIAGETYLSTRRGAWVLTKRTSYGFPFDFDINRRWFSYVRAMLPASWAAGLVERQLENKFDHALFGLKPKHSVFAQHPTISEELPNRIISGMLLVKPNIQRFTADGEGIEWDDGTVTPHVDHVIFATGYRIGFPLLEGGKLVPVGEGNEVLNLYKYMYPVELHPHNTLAVIGCFQPIGSILPLAEMQARLFFDVLAGATRLPPADGMRRDIRAKQEANARRYVESPRHTIQVDYVEFMDELGDMIGCVCRPLRALFSHGSPRLAYQMVFGQVTSYQYRIRGPHAWEGALEAALSVDERVVQGITTRNCGFRPRWMTSTMTSFFFFNSFFSPSGMSAVAAVAALASCIGGAILFLLR